MEGPMRGKLLNTDLKRSSKEILQDLHDAAAINTTPELKLGILAVPFGALLLKVAQDADQSTARITKLTKGLVWLTIMLSLLTFALLAFEAYQVYRTYVPATKATTSEQLEAPGAQVAASSPIPLLPLLVSVDHLVGRDGLCRPVEPPREGSNGALVPAHDQRIRLVRAAPQALDDGHLVLCGNALRLVWIYVKRMELDGETGGYHPTIQPDHCAIDRIGQNSRGAARETG
jgi:hypothetical protein